MNIKACLTYLLLLPCLPLPAQIEEYSYQRRLTGIEDQWHKILLPDEIFGKITADFSDLRIFGVTKTKDTVEAPYLLIHPKDKIIEKDVTFELINQSKNNRGYYFTFQQKQQHSANHIQLDFKQENFDWRLTLEGSHDQKEWFTIADDYRILAIKNELTDFKFTKIIFPESSYSYYRILIDSDVAPEIKTAKLLLNLDVPGKFKTYSVNTIPSNEDKSNKQTVVNFSLSLPLPVCKLRIFVNDSYEYYRPVTIMYVTDSIKTEQGWKYNYNTLVSGTLSSIADPEFNFNSTILKKGKVIIENHDNQPLHIDSMVAVRYIHELNVRFTEKGEYYLVYGKKDAVQPYYDIERFTHNIPDTLTVLQLGREQVIISKVESSIAPLFQNKAWLWAIMGVVIILLGWFSIKMIKQS